jgi:hypothetical protein
VGLDTRDKRPADYYAGADSSQHEPISSMKQQDTRHPACPICECLPCQCDAVDKRFPLEVRAFAVFGGVPMLLLSMQQYGQQ